MGVFSSGGVGIDLGSANVTIFLESEGVVLREPSYVLAARDDPDNVLACGRDARQMLGRTPQRGHAGLSPVMDGAVGDIEMATTLLRELSEKAIGRRRALDRTRVVVSMGLGVTRVERAALEEAVKALGARRAALIRGSVAAAVGAGVSFAEPKGVMVVNIGGSTTEVAVLSSERRGRFARGAHGRHGVGRGHHTLHPQRKRPGHRPAHGGGFEDRHRLRRQGRPKMPRKCSCAAATCARASPPRSLSPPRT